MKTSPFRKTACTFALLSFTCWASQRILPPDEGSLAILSNVSVRESDYGDLVYKAAVYPLKGRRDVPQFHYERHVRQVEGGAESTSFTRDSERAVLIEVAHHGPDFTLREFTQYQFQLGQVGKVIVRGDTAEFRRIDRTGLKTATEKVSLPIVVGPTLYGFILRHWNDLLAGATVPFGFAVVDRLETVGFSLQKVPAPEGQVAIRMRATSPIIALVVSPLFIRFTSGKKLISLEGRVPTKIKVGNEWRDFDAESRYVHFSETYR